MAQVHERLVVMCLLQREVSLIPEPKSLLLDLVVSFCFSYKPGNVIKSKGTQDKERPEEVTLFNSHGCRQK